MPEGAWDDEREPVDPETCEHNWYHAHISREMVCIRCSTRVPVAVARATRHIRLEPELEDGTGTRYGWRLVVEFDPDWQEAHLEIGRDVQGCKFSVHVPDDWVENMAIPTTEAAD